MEPDRDDRGRAMLQHAGNTVVRQRAPAARRGGMARSRLRSSNVVVADGGTKFRLVDHFHRRHDFEGVALRLWSMLFLVGVLAVLVAIGVDLLAKDTYEARVAHEALHAAAEWMRGDYPLRAEHHEARGEARVVGLGGEGEGGEGEGGEMLDGRPATQSKIE